MNLPILNKSGPLTPRALRHDIIGMQLGYWTLNVKQHGEYIRFLIVLDKRNGQYTLAKSNPIHIIGHAMTIKNIVSLFNAFVGRA